jgi:regulation of enolase protein 1 (concanavalin A-like superfamily)
MRRLPILIVVALVSTTGRAQEAMPVQTVALLKEATTFIRTEVDSEVDGSSMSGSGFVIRTEGTTAYIVTNAHVVTPELAGEKFARRPTIRVSFRSGTKAEITAVAEAVASSPERDLALLRVTNVANLPRPVELTTDTEPFETMTVYIFGFPFGQILAESKHNPPVNVGRGQVSSVRRSEDERITSLLLDGALNPGNSGGPVVDTKGRLVGIARATIPGASIGFAIAAAELGLMLNGMAEGTTLSVAAVQGGAAELIVQARLIDPLNRIKSARLLYTQGAARFARKLRQKPRDDLQKRQRGEDDEPGSRHRQSNAPEFVFGPIERAESLPLQIDQHRALGTLPISLSGKDLALWCQVAFVDGSGKTVHSNPACFLAAGKPAADGDKGSTGLTFWGEVVDPDGDCELKMASGDLAVAVPGTLHDLNVDIDKNNGPRVVQEVDGDFAAQVKVTGSFQPGPVRTGPKSVPYNGGGLLVWLDEGNYIRLERAAMYRNNRVVGFLAFESREQGRRAQVHNKGGLNPREDHWLRLDRHGSVLSGSWSRNGQDWEKLEPMEVDWPSRVKVGVDAINSCGDPMTVRFQNYSLVKPKAPSPRPGADQS